MDLKEVKKTWFVLAASIVLYINWIYLPAGKLLYFAGYIAILAWLYGLNKDDEKTPGTFLALSAILLANWPYLPGGDLVYLAGIGVILSASTALLSSSHLDEVLDKTRRYGYVALCFALNWWLFSKQRTGSNEKSLDLSDCNGDSHECQVKNETLKDETSWMNVIILILISLIILTVATIGISAVILRVFADILFNKLPNKVKADFKKIIGRRKVVNPQNGHDNHIQ